MIDISNCWVKHVKGKLNVDHVAFVDHMTVIIDYKVECNIHRGSQVVWIVYTIYRQDKEDISI